jgi:HAD superfamily hydrolase (TIGR01509 family)
MIAAFIPLPYPSRALPGKSGKSQAFLLHVSGRDRQPHAPRHLRSRRHAGGQRAGHPRRPQPADGAGGPPPLRPGRGDGHDRRRRPRPAGQGLRRPRRRPDEAAIAAFLDDLEANSAVLTRPYPGIPETLDALAVAGWGLAICTNKPIAATRALLDTLGLAPRFAVVLGGDSLPIRKPDPGHIRGVLQAAGADAAEAVMIGDHQNDLRAAADAGVRSVFAAWGYGTGEGATLRASAPADLPALLG